MWRGRRRRRSRRRRRRRGEEGPFFLLYDPDSRNAEEAETFPVGVDLLFN